MALIKCGECDKKVSDTVKACIHCGCPTQKKEKNQKTDKEIEHLKKYIKNNKKIKIVILIILGILCLGIGLSVFINKQKDKKDRIASEEKWMKISEGYYSDGRNSIEMDGKGNAKMCVSSYSVSEGCTHPTYSYVYPNGYRFFDDNNFVNRCEVSCSRWDNYVDYIDGLTCYKSDDTPIWIPRIKDSGGYFRCGESVK